MPPQKKGTLIISLDFELYWGMRDALPFEAYKENLLGARAAVPEILRLFSTHRIRATWAVVGLLFCRDKKEMLGLIPEKRPAYKNKNLSPYPEIQAAGLDEDDDPFRYAPSLIEQIRATSGQELACHTFSHYLCQEEGQTAEDFEADLRAANQAAGDRGISFTALVFPKNQVNPDYLSLLGAYGIKVYRGLGVSRLEGRGGHLRRGLRLLDSYFNISGPNTFHLPSSSDTGQPVNIPASRFLRPYAPALTLLESLKKKRIVKSLETAGQQGTAYHLWWHPHNFGRNLEKNLKLLAEVLDAFSALRKKGLMDSLTMTEAAAVVPGLSYPDAFPVVN